MGGVRALVGRRRGCQRIPAAVRADRCSTSTFTGHHSIPGRDRSGANGSAARSQATARLSVMSAALSGCAWVAGRRSRVELPDVPERERPQERAQRRGGVGTGENPAHPAVSQQGHVIDRVRTRGNPRDQRETFNPGCAPLSVGTERCSSASARSPAESARASAGTKPTDDTKFGSSKTTEVAPSV